jgi:SAM-dependent methyltransferase
VNEEDERVRAQYEAYPYPARDPRDEDKRLVSGSPSHLLEIDHYVFAGRRDWTKPFHVLVAGGGTGDGTIMLAQHLADRDCPAEIIYVDVSEASRRTAEARAARRRLANIRFVTGSLLDAASLGTFDYIDCCGVLHHLEDPLAGLKALGGALVPDGGMGVMVYGVLGRTGVYPVQAMMHALGADMPLAKRLLGALPASNWLRHNPHVGDHLQNEAGLHDLLMHSRDRAYTVPDVLRLVAGAGLRHVAWIEPARYEPETYLADAVLRRKIAALATADRAAFAENLCGSLKVHTFYAVHAASAADTVAPFSMDAVPMLRDMDGVALARAMRPGQPAVVDLGGAKCSFPLPPLAAAILERVDGKKSFSEIEASLPQPRDFPAQAEQLYRVMNGLNRMLLRVP